MSDEQEELRSQVVAQCKVVEALAHNLARVYSDKATAFAQGAWPTILDFVGRESARHMELLGDLANGMDIVEAEDSRFDPVFEAAHERWPVTRCAQCGGEQ